MSKRTVYSFVVTHKRKYGFWALMGDMFMIFITGGFWLIWMIIRHYRNN